MPDPDELDNGIGPHPFAFFGALAVFLSLRACATEGDVANSGACLEQGFNAAYFFASYEILGPGPSILSGMGDTIVSHTAVQAELAAQRADVDDAAMAGGPDWAKRLQDMRARSATCRFLDPIPH